MVYVRTEDEEEEWKEERLRGRKEVRRMRYVRMRKEDECIVCVRMRIKNGEKKDGEGCGGRIGTRVVKREIRNRC